MYIYIYIYSYYYSLLSKGPLLRKMVDGAVCNSRLDPGTNDANMATVKKYLASFPDGKSALAFALLNDHCMTSISSTIDESIRNINSKK